MTAVAIIPARAGSKRVPGKNYRPLGGRPVVSYPVRACVASGLFRRIVVSTDSETIATIAREAGAEVPFMRPAELSGDLATTAEVIAHALAWMEAHDRLDDQVCCVYPTAVLVDSSALIRGKELLDVSGAETVLTLLPYGHPVQRALQRDREGRVSFVWPEHELTRSSDLPERFHDAGQFYWMNTRAFLRTNRIIMSDARGLVLPRLGAVDIDTEEDWRLAEALMEAHKRRER